MVTHGRVEADSVVEESLVLDLMLYTSGRFLLYISDMAGLSWGGESK